jgi:Serine carboxypeptidase S28
LKGILNEKYNISSGDSLWFAFGVSYPGALSAWYRLKFPHLTCGSLASSAVVQAVYNFTEFDKQVQSLLYKRKFLQNAPHIAFKFGMKFSFINFSLCTKRCLARSCCGMYRVNNVRK